jgi:signal peptidase I
MARKNETEETLWEFIIDVLINSVVIILIFIIGQKTLIAPFQVVGSSMVNTLTDGEFILVSKVEYYFDNPERGDIVVFHPPHDDEEYYIKRVIGVPGDTVTLKKGGVFVNDKKLDEDYLREGTKTCLTAHIRSCDGDDREFEVPEGEFFVLGDNRHGSSDSRAWINEENERAPFVPKDMIQGKTHVVLYPFPSIRLVEETEVFEGFTSEDN